MNIEDIIKGTLLTLMLMYCFILGQIAAFIINANKLVEKRYEMLEKEVTIPDWYCDNEVSK
jgi:hypothetical protein